MELGGLEPPTSWVRCGRRFSVWSLAFGSGERDGACLPVRVDGLDSRGLLGITLDLGTRMGLVPKGERASWAQGEVAFLRRVSSAVEKWTTSSN